MADTKTYHEQTQIDQTIRLREVLKTLPPFAKDYFRAIEPKSSSRTRINYAYDVRIFFHFLMENNPVYKDYTIDQFKVDDLEKLEPVDIEEYMEYLKVYEREAELIQPYWWICQSFTIRRSSGLIRMRSRCFLTS